MECPSYTARAAALRENRGHCLNCYEDSHSLRQCRQPFNRASGCFNPDFGQLGDDGEAYRRWQARIIRYRQEAKSARSNKKNQNTIASAVVTRVGNTRAKVSLPHKTTASTHLQKKVTSGRGLVTLLDCPPRPPLPLLPALLAPVMVQNTLISQGARATGSSSAQRRPVSIAASPVGSRPSTSSRISGRNSHTYFCEEPTGSFAACCEVTKRYAGDGSLRLERRSSQLRHRSLRFKRRSVGDGSPRFGRRSPQLRHYSCDRSLRLGFAPLSLGTAAHAPSAASPSHAPRSSQTAAPARRSYQRGCPTPPPLGHAVAVGLRCGKADAETPRSRVKLDSAFFRNSGGRSILFPVKEPTR